MADSVSNSTDRKERNEVWAERIRRGDREAFEGLFRAYCDKLCAFIEQYVDSTEVAEGLVQEVFLKVWERRRELDPGKSIRSYLYTLARRQAIDHRRHQKVVEQWTKGSAPPEHLEARRNPDRAFRQKKLSEAIDAAIDELSERQRLVFVLSRRHGLTYKEIAATLDLSVSTIETHMRRSLEALHKKLAGRLPDDFFS